MSDQYEKLLIKGGIRTNNIHSISFAFFIILFSILCLIGLGFITKNIFTGKYNNGQLCIKTNKFNRTISQFTIIFLWINIILSVLIFFISTLPGFISSIYILLLGILTISIYYISKLMFNKDNYCIKISNTNYTLTKIALIYTWIVIGINVFLYPLSVLLKKK